MALLCRIGFHKPRPSTLWNDGYFFSACVRCDAMMIRPADGRWRTVPPHMRVVWRPRGEDDIFWPTNQP